MVNGLVQFQVAFHSLDRPIRWTMPWRVCLTAQGIGVPFMAVVHHEDSNEFDGLNIICGTLCGMDYRYYYIIRICRTMYGWIHGSCGPLYNL